MRREIGLLVFVFAATFGNGIRAGSLETVTTSELPEDFQSMYVAWDSRWHVVRHIQL
jgi:hypothetical protein